MRRVWTKATEGKMTPMIELLRHQDFVDMNREMHEYDEMREKIIKRSREILKASKQAIFALHRSDKTEASKLLATAEKVIPELVSLIETNPSLREGALSSSLEEYAEAKCFSYYLDNKCLPPRDEMPIVMKNEYLGGVIDFTGELMRYAVVKATAREVEEVQRCKDMVEAISGELIQFDFRNGPLRRKFDAVKYNLRKLENTLYELSLVTNSGLSLQAYSVQQTPSAKTRDSDDDL
ncbi:uncharacterized protein CCR75_008368 [Bremia lactucae]|uniref:Translin n=1 Tax=Bremia lactucae TaxID=4779 RepID=A0A976NY28_BRELC|nr:hypothetical protein CCR75_008368 [Bremia lactucae]